MAFKPGNTLAAKSKLFDGALRRAIAQDDADRLRKAAESLLNEAANGKPWAISLLADRLDGKADQTVNVTRNVENMSLAELAAEVAQLRAGDSPEAGSTDGDRPVH
jgi:Flp pilus assembly protein TadG